jgi:periplasmic protein TonB
MPTSVDQAYSQPASGLSKGKLIGAGLVLSIHIMFFWALQSGIAQKSYEKIKNTVEARIILEPKIEVAPEPPKIVPKIEVKPLPVENKVKPEPKPVPQTTTTVTATPPKASDPPKVVSAVPETPQAVAATASATSSAATSSAAIATQAPDPATASASASGTTTAVAKPSPKTGATLPKGTCEEPDYPPISMRAREEGTVLLEFTVNPDGKVVQSKVLSSSGFPRLDDAARNAFGKCKFSPATADGQPVQGTTKVRYTWTMTE